MDLVRGVHNIRDRHCGCVATIGNFDGVHAGHRAVLNRLREVGRRFDLPTVVITFEPYPAEYFQGDKAPPRLTSLREKWRLLRGLGADRLVCLHFNGRLANTSANEFVADILVRRLGIRHLIVGDDFRFGRGREGDFSLLKRAGAEFGFEVESTPTFELDGERVSSTRVRAALAEGRLDLAERLLQRPYAITGRVVHGDKLGRELGYPTANIRFRRPPPLRGIFAVEVQGVDGARLGVASLGTRPTVNGTRTLLEVYLFDYQGDLYGRVMTVVFRRMLRDERRFDSVEALTEQIGRDAEAARNYFRQSAAP